MEIQKLKSSKLFYKKFPFKIECVCKGASKLSYFQLGYSLSDKKIDTNELAKFAGSINFLHSMTDIRIRIEGSRFNIFCKSFEDLELIESKLKTWIQKISGPTTNKELEYLLDNGPKKILCDNLPKHGFKYRIYFKNKFPLEKKLLFLDWVFKNQDKVLLSHTSKRWMLGERFWAQDPFAYVKDEKTLSVIGLQITGFVKCVEEFVERNQALVT